ncbi:MAG: ATP phosphoribosyltransferase regulatory subunit [Candidatus Coproplasma sp.]
MKYFRQEESIISALTTLYESRGFKKIKPACFEDYSLYLDNLDFLISKNVLTFSGAGGRLLALRPDVTLSIVNHSEAECNDTKKLYYTEKVYRRPSDSAEFKEISQAGVEIIGDVDEVCEAETAMLICDTLAEVSDNYILDLSHMGFTEGLISSFNLDSENKAEAYSLLKNKNLHDFTTFAQENNLTSEQIEAFERTVNICGNAEEEIPEAEKIALNQSMRDAVVQLKRLTKILTSLGYGNKININFSIANNADYYNGVIFNGYIDGVPNSVLSGGRYDKLPAKLGKKACAIGFALYLGELERYFRSEGNFVDYLVIYDAKSQVKALEFAKDVLDAGKTVRLAKVEPDDLRYGELIDYSEVRSND